MMETNGTVRWAGMVLVCCLAASSQAVGQGTTAAVYGKWSLDVEATQKAKGNAAGVTGVVAATLEFTSDGKLHIASERVGGAYSQSGTWVVADETGDNLSLEFTTAEESPDTTTLDIRFLEKDTMRLEIKDNNELYVLCRTRVKP